MKEEKKLKKKEYFRTKKKRIYIRLVLSKN
jgi:hypothetical protein